MRNVFVFVTLALLVGAALAHEEEGEDMGVAETEAEVEADAEHPTLPGLGMACLPMRHKRHGKWRVKHPRVFQGACKAEGSCAAGLRVPGHCAGINVVCCKTAPIAEPAKKWVEADAVVRAPKRHHRRHHRHHHGNHHAEPEYDRHRAPPLAAARPGELQPAVVISEENRRRHRHWRHHHRGDTHLAGRHHRHHHRHHNAAAPQTPVPATAPAAPQTPVPAAPIVLKSGVSQCQSQGGVCKDVSTCTGTTQSGLCPGAANIKCCFASAAPATPVTPSSIAGALVSAANTVCANYHARGTTYSQPLRSFGLNVAHSDCSSFVETVFEQAGFSSFWGGRGCAQTSCMRSVITKKGGGYHKNAQLGDIVMWASGSSGHVGIITKVCTPTTFQLTAMGNHGCGPYPSASTCMTWQQMTAYGEGGAAGFLGYWTPH